jgi:hypothetical protein
LYKIVPKNTFKTAWELNSFRRVSAIRTIHGTSGERLREKLTNSKSEVLRVPSLKS